MSLVKQEPGDKIQMQGICNKGSDATQPERLQALSRALKIHGLRLTRQRVLVLEILCDTSEHLTAEDIWEYARKRDSNLNLATVYRTLNVLVEIGLAVKSFLGEGQKQAFYEVVDKPDHFHFTCINCGRVLELKSSLITQARKELSRTHKIEILKVQIKFEGLCAECAAKERANA